MRHLSFFFFFPCAAAAAAAAAAVGKIYFCHVKSLYTGNQV